MSGGEDQVKLLDLPTVDQLGDQDGTEGDPDKTTPEANTEIP